jgi:hypothetical protein
MHAQARMRVSALFSLPTITEYIRTTFSPKIRCEPTCHSTFGDLPCCIDPSTTLQLVTQNVQGITPLSDDDKLQSGISNTVSLQAGITFLTEINVEWRNY